MPIVDLEPRAWPSRLRALATLLLPLAPFFDRTMMFNTLPRDVGSDQ